MLDASHLVEHLIDFPEGLFDSVNVLYRYEGLRNVLTI